MSVRTYLPSVIAIAWAIATPAFAADQAVPWLPPLTQNAAPPPAFDDFDALPGSQPFGAPRYMDWRGFYIGGQFSYSDANANFSNATQAPIAYSLRETTLENEITPSNWPVLGSANHSAAGFGGFVGYNIQYDRLVVGFEANYDQASLSLAAPNSPISRITPADSQGNNYLVNITGSGAVTNLDFGTLRARAGWALGNFLPYGFAGFALGRADVNVTETTSGLQIRPLPASVAPVALRHVAPSRLPALREETGSGCTA